MARDDVGLREQVCVTELGDMYTKAFCFHQTRSSSTTAKTCARERERQKKSQSRQNMIRARDQGRLTFPRQSCGGQISPSSTRTRRHVRARARSRIVAFHRTEPKSGGYLMIRPVDGARASSDDCQSRTRGLLGRGSSTYRIGWPRQFRHSVLPSLASIVSRRLMVHESVTCSQPWVSLEVPRGLTREDGSGETIDRIVRHLDRLFLGRELHDRNYWTENLTAAHQTARISDTEGWRKENPNEANSPLLAHT